jgi:hypothetical protein
MTSTVTTTTVASVTTVTLFASFSLIIALTLLVLLIKKEIISSADYPWAKSLSQMLNVAIPPLFVVFVISAAINLLGVLR